LWCDKGYEEELHRIASKIGLKRDWYQQHRSFPHYDLTARKRELALREGVKEISVKEWLKASVREWMKERRK